MGFLTDFAGAFASNIGGELKQREDQDYQLKLQGALERRRRQYQQEDELRRRKMGNEDRAAQMNLSGPQIGLDDQGRPSLLRVNATVDPMTGALGGSRERVGDAPVTPVGRPFTVYDGQNKRSVQRYSDGSEKDLGEPSPVRAAKSDKAVVNRQRFTTVTNPDGSKSQFDEQTGEHVRDLPSKPGSRSGKGESADAIRKSATEYAKEVAEAEGEVLNSLAAQWGIDQRGLPSDDESKRIAILASMEADVQERLDAARGKSKSKPADKPKDEKPSYAELAAQVKAKRPDLSDAEVRQYLASKGITP